MAWQWKVEVDLESLQHDSELLGKQIGDLDTNLNELKNLIDTMRDFWEGDAAEAYVNLMYTRYTQAVSSSQTLIQLKNAVDTQIEELKTVDQWYEKLWYEICSWFR